MKLTKAETNHLMDLLFSIKRSGSYSGVKKHYYKRTDVLIQKLINQQKEQ